MAENTVVKEQLTDAMISAGAELTRRLDAEGLPITAAFWFFLPDINEWRLLFASPEVPHGPEKVYERIQHALAGMGEAGSPTPLSIIGLLKPDAPLVQLLRMVIHTGPAVSQIRFSKNAINGHVIDDALIFRMM